MYPAHRRAVTSSSLTFVSWVAFIRIVKEIQSIKQEVQNIKTRREVKC
jgi:urease alpha subunit